MLNFENRHYYGILKVSNQATRKEIIASYSRLVKKHNPEGKSFHSQSLKQKAQEKFKLINEAYQTLSNPIKRAEYDAFLDTPIHEEVDGVVDTDADADAKSETLEVLLQDLKSSDTALRRVAALSLGKFKIPEAQDALIEILNDPEFTVTANALKSLGKIGTSRHIESISLIKSTAGQGQQFFFDDAIFDIEYRERKKT
jgi:curved DNA-binding protein CbpA